MRTLIFFIILFTNINIVLSQNIDKKYLIYKQRFEKEFLTSTENPHKTGAFLPVEYINYKGVKYTADEVWYLGLYIAVLSTEYKINIKEHNAKAAEQNIKQLKNILITIDRLDTAAERFFNKPAKLDGFFVRNDAHPNSGFNSQDQIWNLFYGFKMLKLYVKDSSIVSHMKAISLRMLYSMYPVVKIKNGKEIRKWRIIDPNGKILQKPEEMLVSKYAFCKIASSLVDSTISLPGSNNILNRSISATARAGLYHRTTLRKHSHVYNTYGITILTMMAFPDDGYEYSIKIENIALKHFPAGVFSHIPLSSALLYNKPAPHSKDFYYKILRKAPASGPEYGIKSEWNTLNLLACPWQTGWKGKYNGLDFMLLRNLVKLKFD